MTGTHTCTALRPNGAPCTGNGSCASSVCLPGSCAGTQNTCFSAANCSAHCADDNSFCIGDVDCALGTCSGTTTTCTSNANCTMTGSTCVFPVKCLPAECAGPVVCGDAHIAIDYCRSVLSELPLF